MLVGGRCESKIAKKDQSIGPHLQMFLYYLCSCYNNQSTGCSMFIVHAFIHLPSFLLFLSLQDVGATFTPSYFLFLGLASKQSALGSGTVETGAVNFNPECGPKIGIFLDQLTISSCSHRNYPYYVSKRTCLVQKIAIFADVLYWIYAG